MIIGGSPMKSFGSPTKKKKWILGNPVFCKISGLGNPVFRKKKFQATLFPEKKNILSNPVS